MRSVVNIVRPGTNLFQLFISVCLFFVFVDLSAQEIERLEFAKAVKDKSNLHISDYVERITYLPLQTRDDCLVNKIEKIYIKGSKIYILDNNPNGERILIFDTTGVFHEKLERPGRGPGEYRAISDFCVNPDNNDIYILDSSNDVHLYDKNLNFMRSFSTPKASAIGSDGRNIYLYYAWPLLLMNESYSVSVFDTRGNLIRKELNRQWACDYTYEEVAHGFLNGRFTIQQSSDNSLVFWESGFDTVYVCRKGKFEALSVHEIPHKAPLEVFPDVMQKEIKNNFRLYYYVYHPKGDFYRAAYKDELYVFYFNRLENILHHIDPNDKSFYAYQSFGGYKNDLDGAMDFLPKNSGSQYMYSYAFPHNFIEHLSRNGSKKAKDNKAAKALKSMIDTLEISDNPVIIRAILLDN